VAALSTFTFDTVGVSVLFARDLRAVPDQEAGVAGEFVFGLGDDLDYQFLGDKFPARDDGIVPPIGFIELTDYAPGIRGVRGLQRLKGISLRLLDVGADFIVIGCHLSDSLFWSIICLTGMQPTPLR
jgi:hypothetical protein